MPKTKFQEIIFTIIMVIVMVYALVVYLSLIHICNCDACKAYHAESKRKRPCEKEKNAFLSVKHRAD